MTTTTTRDHAGWRLRESGPAKAEQTVLMLPGGLCSGEFYEDVMAEPALASLHLVAATVPGFGRTQPPDDLSMENYAAMGGKLAADLGCDVVVGHSYGANIALEMAAAGTFSGPVVLLSPSFSRKDEVTALGVMNALGKVPGLGSLVWGLMLKGMPGSMKKKFSESRRDALVADLKNNDPGFCKRGIRQYFAYLDRYGSVASRLCDSGVKAWVAFGDDDEIGLQDDERRTLEACANVTLVTIPDATHFMVVEQPARMADLIVQAVASLSTH